MGKSSKKSALKVHAVVPPSKSAKKGKREAKDEHEKQVSAKKQKRDEVAEKQKEAKVQKNKTESSSDDSSSDSEQDEKPAAKVAFPSKEQCPKNCTLSAWEKKGKPASCSNISKSSDDDSNEHEPTTPATLKEQNAALKTVYVRNLSYSVERADMESLFKGCGEIVDVHLYTDKEGRFRGFGHVEFATAEAAQKALELDGKELLRCPVSVDIAQEKGEHSILKKSIRKGQKVQSKTVFVKGFDKSLAEEEIKTSLEEHFSSCGEITGISIPKNYNSGAFKGFAYLDFKDVDSLMKALKLHQTKLGGYPLSVNEAKPRVDNHGTGRRRGVGGQFGGKSRRGCQFGGKGGGSSRC